MNKILFVDDDQLVLDSLRRMLRSKRDVWEMTFVDHPEAAWKQLLEQKFDAVIADVNMPGLSGLQLLERIKQAHETKDLPVVMLTGLADRELKRQALQLGATDLLNKPVEPEDLLARIQNVLRLKSYQDELKAHNYRLEQTVRERTAELSHSRLDVIWRLGKAAEHRGEETGNHVIRVGYISRVIGEVLALDSQVPETLFLAAPLHDIGKIGIPDAILLKRGSLSSGEWKLMKQHCVIGKRILREDSKIKATFLQWRGAQLQSDCTRFVNPMLEMAASIALTHHERWDGTGYPHELAGEEMPVESRIVAISDVFDALTSKRPYKAPYPEDKALQIVSDGAGNHFDPSVYQAFIEALPEIQSIRVRFADSAIVPPKAEETGDEKSLVCR